MQQALQMLIDESNEMIVKPDFSTKTGREFLAFYLRTKFKKILAYDKKSSEPIFLSICEGFLDKFLKRLIYNPQQRILIALTGESACGKTTICKKLFESIYKFDLPISIISADNYFNDISSLIKIHGDFDKLRDAGYDVDSPSSFQLDLLKEDLIKLQDGHDIKAPQYLVNGTGMSVPKSISVKSRKIIVAEGMATLYNGLDEIFDIKIYVDLHHNVRKQRFLTRAQERNQDSSNALKHWDYIHQAGQKYIVPSRENCDMIINGNAKLDHFADMIEYINHVTNNFKVV